MSDIKLIIDGKEYICRPVEKETDAAEKETDAAEKETDAAEKETDAAEKETDAAERGRPRTGYERVNEEQEYYTVYNDSYDDMSEENMQEDDENYSVGNYYNDEQLAVDIARAETLMRRMRQWQALNDDAVDWDNVSEHYYITYNRKSDGFEILWDTATRDFGTLYFSSEEKAQEALDIFRDELMWYFTEYRQRLDEPKVK